MSMDITPEEAVVNAFNAWRRVEQLVEFATRRHGYGDSDGGFGVTYPGDLDDYEREVLRIVIPEGSLSVYGFWGVPDGYDILVEEAFYLRCLVAYLHAEGRSDLAVKVSQLERFSD